MQEVSIYHIAEIFLYEYYCNRGEYHIREQDALTPLMERGDEQEKRGGYIGALQTYEKALKENPVSMAVYEKIVECCRRLGDLEEMHRYTLECWPYCCTRSELAWYYRSLGYYYLEIYRPELSEVLYRYSTLFAKSEQAENEISYLERALEKKMPEYSAEELQQFLKREDIPTVASDVTMALLVRAGEEAASESAAARGAGQSGRSRAAAGQARDCYQMVFDLTGDEEIRARLGAINSALM